MAGCQTKALGRVGHWTFGEGKGDSKNWASPGNKSHYAIASDEGAGYTWMKGGRFGDSYYCIYTGLEGSEDSICCGKWDDLGLAGTNTMSAEIWFRISSWSSCGTSVFGAYRSSISCPQSSCNSYAFCMGPCKAALCGVNGGFFGAIGGCGIAKYLFEDDGLTYSDFANKWNHLVLTYDGSTVKLYVNGELKGATSYSGSIKESTSYKVWIGANRFSLGQRTDEAILYNRVLDEDDARFHYLNRK